MKDKLAQKEFLAVVVLFTICQLGSLGCSDYGMKPVLRTDLKSAQYQKQGFVVLPFEEIPNASSNRAASDLYIEPLDDDSIEMYLYRDNLYYQPVNLCHRIYAFIGSYHATGDKKYLDRAVKYTSKLIELLHYHDKAGYLPYEMRYAVHGDSANTLPAPWYSGMAQGEFLGVLVRMYEISDDKHFLEVADDVFLTMMSLESEHEIAVARLDNSGYYWIEEYPHDLNPGMTLNGYIFALYGLYDYYRVTKKNDALRIWELSLTTLKHYLPQFERRGKTSLYCLGHFHPASAGYHNIHVRQMGFLHQMSGDIYFRDMQELLEKDGQTAFGTGSN